MKFCDEKGLCVGNTNFKHKRLCKYTRVSRVQKGSELEHGRSGVDKERYDAGCEGNERNGMKSFITLLYYVKSGWCVHELRE